MNGIEKISQKILAEAQERAAGMTAEAEREAKSLLDEARAAAEKECAEIRAAAEQRAQTAAELAQQNAAAEGRRRISAEKNVMINRAFELAQKKLLELPDGEYTVLLARLAAQAYEGGDAELVFSEKDRGRCGQAVTDAANAALGGAHLRLAEDAAPISGGVILRRGKIEINCALEVMIRLLSEELSPQISECLFGKGA